MIRIAVGKYDQLNVLYNNASITGEHTILHDSTEENWDKVININLRGMYLCMKYAIPQMLKQGVGVIVNTASEIGLVAFPNMSAYCDSKGGVVQLTKAAAIEYSKQNIRVNCTCPSSVATPMLDAFFCDRPDRLSQVMQRYPIGRSGTAQEITAVAPFPYF